MYPCTGGIDWSRHEPSPEGPHEPLPPMRDSPQTMRALRWVYDNPLRDDGVEGYPVYCKGCKELGWHWPD